MLFFALSYKNTNMEFSLYYRTYVQGRDLFSKSF